MRHAESPVDTKSQGQEVRVVLLGVGIVAPDAEPDVGARLSGGEEQQGDDRHQIVDVGRRLDVPLQHRQLDLTSHVKYVLPLVMILIPSPKDQDHRKGITGKCINVCRSGSYCSCFH